MADGSFGKVLAGSEQRIGASWDRLQAQPVDQEMLGHDDEWSQQQTTIRGAVSVTGPGTFFGRAQRTLRFEPVPEKGWWFDRTDLDEAMPIRVSINNVWTTARNIVLCSGSPHNYMRMVEHIVALKVGLGLDNLTIRMDSGDPPLFDRSSMDLVEAMDKAGVRTMGQSAVHCAVKEPVTVGGPNGSFLTFLPPEDKSRRLIVDCAIDFRSAIGKQRIRFAVNRKTFRHGAAARTNTTYGKMLYCKTFGMLFADVRNLGYTPNNILIAGRRRYFNKPGLVYKGKSLEAAWHRATLDLLAAVALIDKGRFVGKIVSYKAGHTLDVTMVRELYQRGLLEVV